jgi:hypothetical protein
MYGDRVDYPAVWNKVVVIAREDDPAASRSPRPAWLSPAD